MLRQHIRDAYEHYNNGDPIAAYQLVTSVLQTDRSNTGALMLYAEIIKQHQPREALDILKRLHSAQPHWEYVELLVDELEETLVN